MNYKTNKVGTSTTSEVQLIGRGVRYFPFSVDKNEIEDISLKFDDENLSRAIFSSMCIIDYKKNKATSEIAYNGKTVDIVHVSTLDFNATKLNDGTLIKIDLEALPDIDALAFGFPCNDFSVVG